MSVDFFSNLNGGTLTLSDDFQKELGKVFKGSTNTVLKLLDNDGTGAPQTLDDGVQILTSEKWGDIPGVEVDADICALLGIDVPEDSKGKLVTVSYGDFVSKCFDKMSSAFKDGEIDLDKLEGNDIEMLCLLLCQSSKDKLVNVLKNALAAKKDERNILNSKLIAEHTKLAEERVKAAAAAKKARTRSIFKSIFGAIAAVLSVVVAAAVTVATAGAGAPMVAASVALGLSVVSAACTLTATGLSIGAMYTNNENLKAKLNKANMIIGITGAAAGLIGAIASGFALSNIHQSLSGIIKLIHVAGQVGNAAVQIGEGSLGIIDGAENISLAKTQKEIANIRINLEKLDQGIEALNQFIELLNENMQMFIKNILESEQMFVNEFGKMSNVLLSLSNSPV